MRTRPKWSVSSLKINLEECHEFTPGPCHLLSPSHPHHRALCIRREVDRDIELSNSSGIKICLVCDDVLDAQFVNQREGITKIVQVLLKMS